MLARMSLGKLDIAPSLDWRTYTMNIGLYIEVFNLYF